MVCEHLQAALLDEFAYSPSCVSGIGEQGIPLIQNRAIPCWGTEAVLFGNGTPNS